MDTPLLIGAAAPAPFCWVRCSAGGSCSARARARQDAESQAARILEAANADVERIRQAAELAGREEAYRAKQEWEREEARRREELERPRAASRSGAARSTASTTCSWRRTGSSSSGRRSSTPRRRAGAQRAEYARLQQEAERASRRWPAVAGGGEKLLMQQMEEQARAQAANTIREIRENARREAEREAKNILALAIQRIAADHTAESTVSVVSLPSDEMKGRIIGREGRNIRAFEQATGIDVIIDDTPEAVILSGFDPIRRESRAHRLEKLVADGRIHPARIEEVVAKARKEVDDSMLQAAEEVCYELGVHGIHPEIMKVLGRLRTARPTARTSCCTRRRSRSSPATWRPR
jgi:ribonucrease Y